MDNVDNIIDTLRGALDSFLLDLPPELRFLIFAGLGLMAIAIVMKLIGAAIRLTIALVVIGVSGSLFVVISHNQGWIDWPFYDGETVTLPDIPDLPTEIPELPSRDDLPTLPKPR